MTSSFSCSRLQISSKSFWTTPPSGSACIKFIKARRQVVNARFERHNRGGSKIVDENMIILRMRIKEMKLLEAGKSRPPSNWMGWEKKYFARYNEDVCEVIGLLQMYLMETRPALALGMLALLCLSVPFSTYVLVLHIMEMAKFILHLN
ncbi:hypothetical protein RND71_011732 [Anisodus tanguticus]|uniref:Uncharacterized protein n=1 Tax=Anisodus tanguticus TaxID=243964 RepID=A0AAE1SDU9_9SOLA|nr:hypothetical protein RND71_011732 [Anisodus tanguticus]